MLARILLLITVVAWGWSFVATKICLEYMTPVEVLGLRLLTGLPFLFLVAAIKRVRFRFDPKTRIRLMAVSLLLLVHFLIQIIGLNHTSATNTGWIVAVTPLVTVIAAYIFLRERIGRRDVAGIVVATIGIVILVSRGNPGDISWLSSIGDWLILLSTFTWAIYTVSTRDISRSQSSLAVICTLLTPVGILIIIWMIMTSDWGVLIGLPTRALVSVLYLGVFATAIAHWFWQEGIARIGASKAGIFLYLEPLATMALAVPLLHESFGPFTVIGGLMVLGGVYWSQRTRR